MNLINVANFFLNLKSMAQRFHIRFQVFGKDDNEKFYISFIFNNPNDNGITSVCYTVTYEDILNSNDVYELASDVLDNAIHLAKIKYNKKVQERMKMSMED